MSKAKKRIGAKGLIGVGLVVVLASGAVFAQMSGSGPMHGQMHDRMHGHGADGKGHDEANMPGLRGVNTTPEETAEMAAMFRNFRTITREVVELENGIRTVTRSSDPKVMEQLVSHVTVMIDRVERGDDPKVFIQSRTLDIMFERGDQIETSIEVTDNGVVVTQISDDPEIVTALKVHAAEVTDMADRGMHAVHEKMMRQARN